MRGPLQSRPQPWSMTSDGSVLERGSTEAPRILAIEDDRAVQKVLKRLFESEGVQCRPGKGWAFGSGALLEEESFRDRPRSAFAGHLRRRCLPANHASCSRFARYCAERKGGGGGQSRAPRYGCLRLCDQTIQSEARELLARVRVALRRSDRSVWKMFLLLTM